jgi:osmoprotectant transport system permease protein
MLNAYYYVMQHPMLVTEWIIDHLRISMLAIIIGTVLGVNIGIFIAKKGKEQLADIVFYFAEITMTIPSLALFGLLMLLLGSMGFNAIGFLPAVITLVIYNQLPILRNTYTAIRQVDQNIIDAGRGMGMSESQLLLRIKLPLAIPLIMAGLRNAMVLTIGITAIAALIGAGGLGVPIFRGLRNARMDLIIIGGVSVSILALLIDGLMALLERCITPKGLRS